jgi:hypothetical protein
MRTENDTPGTLAGRRLPILVIPFAFCLSLGCADTHFFDRDKNPGPDPLTGLSPRTGPVASTGSDGRTPAALASSRDSVSGLGIRDADPSQPRDRTVQTTGWTGTRPADNSGTPALGTPTTGAAVGTNSSPMASNGSGRIRTFEDAQKVLMARGVRAQELRQRENGEWQFTCSIPIAGAANRMKTYDETDRYGLIAIQKVIDKMNQDGNR